MHSWTEQVVHLSVFYTWKCTHYNLKGSRILLNHDLQYVLSRRNLWKLLKGLPPASAWFSSVFSWYTSGRRCTFNIISPLLEQNTMPCPLMTLWKKIILCIKRIPHWAAHFIPWGLNIIAHLLSHMTRPHPIMFRHVLPIHVHTYYTLQKQVKFRELLWQDESLAAASTRDSAIIPAVGIFAL